MVELTNGGHALVLHLTAKHVHRAELVGAVREAARAAPLAGALPREVDAELRLVEVGLGLGAP